MNKQEAIELALEAENYSRNIVVASFRYDPESHLYSFDFEVAGDPGVHRIESRADWEAQIEIWDRVTEISQEFAKRRPEVSPGPRRGRSRAREIVSE